MVLITIMMILNTNLIFMLTVHGSFFSMLPYMCSSGAPNIHNAWPHSLVTFQDFNQTPSHQNRANVRAAQDAYPTPTSSSSSSSSAYPSVASCISNWEQRLPLDSSSQSRHPWTPQYRSRTPAACHGSSSVGRRRGQRWATDTEATATTLVYGLDLEAGSRVSVCVLEP